MRRAFTLVEVIVAGVLSAIILSTVTTIIVNTLVEGKRTRVQQEMARDAALVAQLFAQELRQAGLGVPNKQHINSAYGTVASPSFYASLLVAGDEQIGIVGDLARPDSNFNAYGPLHNRQLPTTNIAWHTESNGNCVPDGNGVGTSCVTGDTSIFFPGENGCDATTDFADRTCAWGLRRVLAGDHLVIVSGDGRWGHATFGNTINNVAGHNAFAAQLSTGWVSTVPGDWPDPPSPSLAVTSPVEVAGQGWVATLDRVFFKYDLATRTIQRIQCTGDPDPDHTNWPPGGAAVIPGTLTYTPGGTGGTATTCGPFEIVARHVESLDFDYFNAAGTDVGNPATGATKKLVRRVSYRIQFRQTVDTRDVIYDVSGSVRLQNVLQ